MLHVPHWAADRSQEVWAAVQAVAAAAPFRQMRVPGGGTMSAAMTNCGRAGWVSDGGGYRYSRSDPETGQHWPAMPSLFAELAARAAEMAGFPDFAPDVCLINRYEPGARMGLHQDRDERDFSQPIVSLSFGMPAVFLWGGARRHDPVERITLNSGDVVVWGGAERLFFHGIAPVAKGAHPLTGACRINLTLRKAL